MTPVPNEDSDHHRLTTIDSLIFRKSNHEMDIEGFEYSAMLGALKTITTHWPVMIIEQNTDDFRASDLLVNELGYSHVGTCPRGWDRIFVKPADQRPGKPE